MSDRTCSVDGCERPRICRGWCRPHYKRWLKTGDVRPGIPIEVRATTPEESFAARTERRGDCLIWTGATNSTGYGQIAVPGGVILAHRYAWEREHGPTPEGMFVDHRYHCDHACCETAHLRPATAGQNGSNRAGARPTRIHDLPRNVELRGASTYCVRIKHNGVRHYFGPFPTAEDAAVVAERERARIFGEFAGRG